MSNRRWIRTTSLVLLPSLASFFVPCVSLSMAEGLESEAQMGEFVAKVVDGNGDPVAGAEVIPWALRAGGGHGLWADSDDEDAPPGPKSSLTDDDGLATVAYPLARGVKATTTQVSIFIDHPKFAFFDTMHVNVPRIRPAKITLSPGGDVVVRPMLDGKPVELDKIHAIWSDGRSWRPSQYPIANDDGTYQISAMPAGENCLLLVRLDGALTTHFSAMTDFEIEEGKVTNIEVPLVRSRRINGVLSPNVPRPVRNGRVKLQTIRPPNAIRHRPQWQTWATVQANGRFTITGWPTGERIQLIALTDDHIAKSGNPPDGLDNPPPVSDTLLRPQVFGASVTGVEVKMTPLASCEISVVEHKKIPAPNIKVESYPNVFWWNSGSQVYCHPLIRGEKILQKRAYLESIDESFPYPFETKTDKNGACTLQLPVGVQSLYVSDKVYELPAFLGEGKRVTMVKGETTKVRLKLVKRKVKKAE